MSRLAKEYIIIRGDNAGLFQAMVTEHLCLGYILYGNLIVFQPMEQPPLYYQAMVKEAEIRVEGKFMDHFKEADLVTGQATGCGT